MKCSVKHSTGQSLLCVLFVVAAHNDVVHALSLPTRSRRSSNVALNVATGMVPPSIAEKPKKKKIESDEPFFNDPELQSPSPLKDGDFDNRLLAYDKEGYPRLGSLMKALPKKIFEVNTAKSLFYFGVDTAACVASIGFLYAVVTSDIYHSMAVWQQALTVAPLQILAGFAMWCQWCIGHDAGHSLISKKYKWLNTAVGEIVYFYRKFRTPKSVRAQARRGCCLDQD